MEMKMKNIVTQRMTGESKSHALTEYKVRDLSSLVDEPLERGGSNLAPTPTETLMGALVGCTNVITHKIAHKHGIEIQKMDIDVKAKFDRRGVTLEEEIDVPFPEIELNINLTTDADESSVEILKTELPKFCAVSKVIRQSGTVINENWSVTRS